MAAAGALHVIHVDGTAFDRRHRILAEAVFVDRVRVKMNREIVAVRRDQALVDHGRSGPEILVNLNRHATRCDRFLYRFGA